MSYNSCETVDYVLRRISMLETFKNLDHHYYKPHFTNEKLYSFSFCEYVNDYHLCDSFSREEAQQVLHLALVAEVVHARLELEAAGGEDVRAFTQVFCWHAYQSDDGALACEPCDGVRGGLECTAAA